MKLNNMLKILKKVNEVYTTISPASAILSVGESSIELDIAGKPFAIEISYNGICRLTSLLSLVYKINFLKNKIIITNPFRRNFPLNILSYTGKINITDCEILTYTGHRFKATIKNIELQEVIQGQRTKFEDDSMIIYDEPSSKLSTPFRKNSSVRNFTATLQNIKARVSRLSKEERKEFVGKLSKAISKKMRTKVSKPVPPKSKYSAKKKPTGGRY